MSNSGKTFTLGLKIKMATCIFITTYSNERGFFFFFNGGNVTIRGGEGGDGRNCLFGFFFLNFIISYLKFWIFKMIYFKFLTLLFDFYFFFNPLI